MRLYIVRHGEARAQGAGERSLTLRGETEVDAAGRLLAGEAVDTVLFSPKLRTRQTAMRLLDAVGEVRSGEEAGLLPPTSCQRVADAVEGYGGNRLVLVSHLPLVAELVGWFRSGDASDYPLAGFPSGGIVALDLEYPACGQGSIAWHAFPPGYERVR
jgi:phosphohistidine phosphatase SixA